MADPEAAYQKYLRYRDEFRALEARYRKLKAGGWNTPKLIEIDNKLGFIKETKNEIRNRYNELLEYFDTLSEVVVDRSGRIRVVSPQGFNQAELEAHVKPMIAEATKLKQRLFRIEVDENKMMAAREEEIKRAEDEGVRLTQVERLMDEAYREANR